MTKYVMAIKSKTDLLTEGRIYTVTSERFIRDDAKIRHFFRIVDDSGGSAEYENTYLRQGNFIIERIEVQKALAEANLDVELAALLSDAIEQLKEG